jgi:hypothetical protein
MSVTMMPSRPRLKEATRKAMFSSSSYTSRTLRGIALCACAALNSLQCAFSMEFRAILIICVAKFSTFVSFLQSEFGVAKLVLFFVDFEAHFRGKLSNFTNLFLIFSNKFAFQNYACAKVIA